MHLNDITLVIAIDARHVEELSYTWPTWMKFKPELRNIKKIVIYDKTQIDPAYISLFNGIEVKFVPWDMEGVSQREKMLTSLVKVPTTVDTPWYLKLDADTIAVKPGKFILDEWFHPKHNELPAYIAHGWPYSKPSDVLKRLDDWADNTELNINKRLDIPFDPASERVYSKRITSWCYFGNTEWTAKMSRICGDRLPVPSQDTFMYYCAARTGAHTVRTNMKRFGWEHLRLRSLRKKSEELLRD